MMDQTTIQSLFTGFLAIYGLSVGEMKSNIFFNEILFIVLDKPFHKRHIVQVESGFMTVLWPSPNVYAFCRHTKFIALLVQANIS